MLPLGKKSLLTKRILPPHHHEGIYIRLHCVVTYTEVMQILIKERRPPQWIIGYGITTPGVSFDKPREGVQEIYPKYTSSNAAYKHL